MENNFLHPVSSQRVPYFYVAVCSTDRKPYVGTEISTGATRMGESEAGDGRWRVWDKSRAMDIHRLAKESQKIIQSIQLVEAAELVIVSPVVLNFYMAAIRREIRDSTSRYYFSAALGQRARKATGFHWGTSIKVPNFGRLEQ